MHNVCGNAAVLPLFAGVACFALVCAGFCVLNSQTRRYPAKRNGKNGSSSRSSSSGKDEMESSKRERFDIDTQAAETREDRISQLPDDVISSIISRLTTSGAVRTSVLSRRWRHIFTFMNKVEFCCYDVYGGPNCIPGSCGSQLQRKFVERVDTFLQHHSGSKIMSFELVCCFRGCILDKFRKWMNFVGTLGVEQLTLGFCCRDYLEQSCPPVFSTDFLPEPSSLKHLWLRGGSFLTPNKNALRVIELDNIAFTSEAVQCMLSNCSSLQLLNLRFCALPTKLLIHGPHLQLKSLMICHCNNVEEIDLYAINLINLEIYNLSILKLSFSCVPLLQTLVIEFYGSKVAPYVFGKIAEDVPHLESMTFTTRASFFEGCKLDQLISKLSNLRHLVLILEYYNKLDLLELAVFLDSCPLLRKFQLSMVVMSTFNLKQARERMDRRDTQLKEVELNGFSGANCEYNFILYILKTVVSLERLVLSAGTVSYNICHRRWMASITDPRNAERRHQIIRKRLQGQSISKNVEIITL